MSEESLVVPPLLPTICPICGCSVPLATYHMGVDIATGKPYWTCERGSHEH